MAPLEATEAFPNEPTARVGSIVVLQGLTSDRGQALNGRLCFVATVTHEICLARRASVVCNSTSLGKETTDGERLGVVVLQFPPPGNYSEVIAVRRANVAVQASARALMLHPDPQQPADPARVRIEPFEFAGETGSEPAEKAALAAQLGWAHPTGSAQTFYSKYSGYPDLFLYWDAAAAGPAFPLLAPLHPSLGAVRGPVVLLRSEPPVAVTGWGGIGGMGAPGSTTVRNTTLWTEELGVEEVRETLRFFETTSFHAEDETRWVARAAAEG